MKKENQQVFIQRLFLSALFMALAFVFLPVSAVAQNPVKGKVVDEKGASISSASILIKGTNKGIASDASGTFMLNDAKEGTILIISSVGFVPKEVKVKGSEMQIVLKEKAEDLTDVVVVGYGTIKRKDLTGSVASVNGNALAATGQTSVMGALRGLSPGVSVTQGSGKLGTGYNIQVRAKNSITGGSDPLIIVDGVQGGDMNALNPADIDKIDILKDASGTAIYGSRGANGVVVVTTKRGKAGKNTLSYEGKYGVTTPIHLPDLFNGDEYVKYADSAYVHGGVAAISSFERTNATNRKYVDWMDRMLQNGTLNTHTVSFSGGNDNEKHYISLGYDGQSGNLEKEMFNRYNLKASVEGKATKNLTLGLSLYGRFSDIDNGSREALRTVFRARPTAQPTDANGNEQFFMGDYRPDRYPNPWYDIQNEKENIRQFNMFGNLFAEYQIINGLSFRSTFAPYVWNSRSGYSASTFTKTNKGTALPKGELSNANGYSYTWDNVLTYTKTINTDHRLSVMGGTSTYSNFYEDSYIKFSNMPADYQWYNIGSAGMIDDKKSSYWKESLSSFMGRIQYGYKDKYLFTATGRYDGSSKLAEGHKWGFFPSAAIGWRISQEDFLKDNKVVDDLKLRLSYGVSGNNNVGAYSTLLGTSNTSYDWGGTAAGGQYLNKLPNYNLGWEKGKELNLGLDFSIWNKRISGTVDVYQKDNKDLILPKAIPQTNGWSNVAAVNVGATRNTGIEIGLTTTNVTTKNFSWTTNLNFSTYKNKITQLYGDGKDDVGNSWFIGKPSSVFYIQKWMGIWQTSEAKEAAKYGLLPGSVKVLDVDSNYAINAADNVICGNPFPSWTGGMTNNFTYKNLDLSIYVYTRQGEMKNSAFHAEIAQEYIGEMNRLKVDYWTETNPSNTFWRLGGGALGNTSLYNYKDCSFVRVGNITLGYNFNEKALNKMKLSRVRVYASAVNPILWTKYDGLDPEFSTTGVYYGAVSTATYMLGLNITF